MSSVATHGFATRCASGRTLSASALHHYDPRPRGPLPCLSGARTATEAAVAVGDGLAPRPRPRGMGPLDGTRRGERSGGNRDGHTPRADASGTQTHRPRRVAACRWLADGGTVEAQTSLDDCDQNAHYGYRYYLTPTCVAHRALRNRRWENWRVSSKRDHALKPAFNAARMKQAWTNTRSGPGRASITTWR